MTEIRIKTPDVDATVTTEKEMLENRFSLTRQITIETEVSPGFRISYGFV
jgi:hypothetical protein